jgi:hypothetical protein
MSPRAALAAAERGAKAWRTVVAAQGANVPEQHGFHVLAGELVDTVRALDLVAGVLLKQVHSHGDQLVADDKKSIERLVSMAGLLADLHAALDRAGAAASGFCTQLGPIADEVG